MPTLDELNAADAAGFTRLLEGVCENAPWVAQRAAVRRPFATVADLHAALLDVLREADAGTQVEFLNGHPELSPKALADPALSAESRAEQSGLGAGAFDEGFAAQAAEYRAKHGIPFIVCVRRRTPWAIRQALAARLPRAPEEERAAALEEVGHIVRLRLVDRVTGPGMPRTGGHLSTHVLDTARGCPAGGMCVELLCEGRVLKDEVLNGDGRTEGALIEGEPIRMGRYELRFHAGDYFAAWGGPAGTRPELPWYDVIPVRFAVSEPEGHYHIPLLVSGWTYTTYRGS